jgi:hypothetical protein
VSATNDQIQTVPGITKGITRYLVQYMICTYTITADSANRSPLSEGNAASPAQPEKAGSVTSMILAGGESNHSCVKQE